MDETRNIAPMKLEMLVAIVPEKKVAYFSSLIQSCQANMQVTLPAQGTTHILFNYLGIVEKPKNMIISIVRQDEAQKIIDILNENFQKAKELRGVAFTVRLASLIGTQVYGFLSNDKRVMEEA